MRGGVLSSSVNVLLVDDHQILREGLKNLIEVDPAVRVVGMAGSAQEGLQHAIRANVQVAIIDLSLPDQDGLWLLERLKESKPELHVIVLSMHADQATVVKILSSGASGYLTKSADSKELLTAIHAVHSGGSYLQPQIAPFLLGALRETQRAQRPAEFSERELTVLSRVADGQSNQQIADELFLSVSTVKAHLRSLFGKLGVSTRTELVVEGIRRNLIVSRVDTRGS